MLEGPGILPGLTFVEWGQDGGEVFPVATRSAIDGTVEISVLHFSGAGAASGPAPESRAALSRSRRAEQMVEDARGNDLDGPCVKADSQAGTVALDTYLEASRDDALPPLQRA